MMMMNFIQYMYLISVCLVTDGGSYSITTSFIRFVKCRLYPGLYLKYVTICFQSIHMMAIIIKVLKERNPALFYSLHIATSFAKKL